MKKKEIFIALIIALLLAIFISPFASDFPDGLERVAEDEHFIEREKSSSLSCWFEDYTFPCFASDKIQTAAAGFFGTLVVFLIGIGCAKLISFVRMKDAN